MGPSWRSLAAAVLLLGTGVMGCKDAEAPQPDPDVVAIRRMIGDWERSMELDDEPALQPLFEGGYWPHARSRYVMSIVGGHSLRVTDVEIEVGVQHEQAVVSFQFSDLTDHHGWAATWMLTLHQAWLVSEEYVSCLDCW